MKRSHMDELINRYRTSINPPYKFRDYLNLTLTLLLLIGLPVGLYLSQQKQDIRQRAQEITKPHPGKPEAPSVPDEILVKFKPGVTEKAKENVMKRYGLTKKDAIPKIDVLVAKVPEKAKDKVINALSHNPRIEYAEPNRILEVRETIPNDPYYINAQWNLQTIGAPLAWDISKGSSSVVVAEIDTGVTVVEDLVGKVVPGYNFLNNTTDTNDDNNHGTRVAGFIAALTNNSIGVASLGWNTPVMPLKANASPGCGCLLASDIAKAMVYAADHGAKVINISASGKDPMPVVQDSANYAWSKGVVTAAAAGNDGTCCIEYPAAAEHIIGVGASGGGDVKADLSNIDDTDPTTPIALDVLAPGSGLTSTDRSGTYPRPLGGTSYSSPQVAALAALIFSANPGLNNQQVVDIITSTAKDLGDPGWDQYFGCGRIDAAKALQVATGVIQPLSRPSPCSAPLLTPDTTLPTAAITTPTNLSPVSGSTVAISVAAFDTVGVTKVEVYIDSNLLGTSLTAPYTFSWDSTTVINGTHTILAKAYDAAGNVGTSSTVTVTVNNSVPDTTPPTVSITSPTANQTLLGTVPVSAFATDNVAVSSVSFFVDNVFIGESTTSPYSISWDTSGVVNGTHTLTAIAFDAANNNTTSTPVSVTVANTVPSPTPTPSPTLIPTFTPIPTSPPLATPTPTPNLQTTVVTFSSISAQSTANTATINWTTNIPSSSRVAYGISSTNPNLSTTENVTLTTTHNVFLNGLFPNTRYYYKVLSKNSLGDEFSSTVKNFKTKNR